MWERVSLVGGQQVESGHQYNLSDQKRRPTTSFEEFPLEAEDLTQLIDTRERPELHAERLELRGWIERGLGTLPVEQREVLILYDSEGYSYQEIVEITGFPMGTVKSRLCRGRSRLRDFLVRPQQQGEKGSRCVRATPTRSAGAGCPLHIGRQDDNPIIRAVGNQI